VVTFSSAAPETKTWRGAGTVNEEQLQKLEDAYLVRLNASLQPGQFPPASGDWNWPAYGVTKVSAVVIGHRHREPPAGGIEVVYLVTIYSQQPIPNAGKATRESGLGGNSYTFVQLAASVAADGYETQFVSTYVGTNPYASAAPVRLKRAKHVEAKAVRLDGDPMPPHPPP
jgi:hypothetical protein